MNLNRPMFTRKIILLIVVSILTMRPALANSNPPRPTSTHSLPDIQASQIERYWKYLSSKYKPPECGLGYPNAEGDDPDLDELTNEWEYFAGTDPCNSDTDGGGENDGSEVTLHGLDPLDPSDDEIEAIDSSVASLEDSAIILTYDVKAEYTQMRLFRSTHPQVGYVLYDNDIPLSGTYTDSNVVARLPYFYRLMAIDAGGHRSAVSTFVEAVVGQPNLTPVPIWDIGTVDDVTNTGRHLSAAIEPSSGMIYLSYYDDFHGDLLLAKYVGSGGDCGPVNDWMCETVDSSGDVGMYNSIAIYESEGSISIGIAYYDATNGALKFASGPCSRSGCSLDTHTIDIGNPAISVYKGRYASLGFGHDGIPHIAYQFYSVITNDALLYAHRVGDGTGNCGQGDETGEWVCESIHSGSGFGMYASLGLDGSDHPSIAYYEEGNGYPWLATLIGMGGNCGPGTRWYCRRINQLGLDTGRYISLFLEDNGSPHIAYYNATNKTLEYAVWVGADGNCGYNSTNLKWEWQCDEISAMGSSINPMGISLLLDGDGYPMIAFQDASDDLAPAGLKIARPLAALPLDATPNCGPKDQCLSWHCKSVDRGGPWTDEAGSISLVMNSSGLATIAYHELDSYVYPITGNPKLASQRLLFFLPLALLDG